MSPVNFCNYPAHSNVLTEVRHVPAKRNERRSCSSDFMKLDFTMVEGGDRSSRCSLKHKTDPRVISSVTSSSFTVYEGNTMKMDPTLPDHTSPHECLEDSDMMSDSESYCPYHSESQYDDALPAHPLVTSHSCRSQDDLSLDESSSKSPCLPLQTASKNFFFRPLFNYNHHHISASPQACHHSHKFHHCHHQQQQYHHPHQPSVIRVSPFEPIVKDRNFNGKISPLPQEEYQAWQKKREKNSEELFYQNHTQTWTRDRIVKRPVAISPVESPEVYPSGMGRVDAGRHLDAFAPKEFNHDILISSYESMSDYSGCSIPASLPIPFDRN